MPAFPVDKSIMNTDFNISSLKKASESFYKSLDYAQKKEKKGLKNLDEYEFETVRSSVIQHFEIVYELCWKTMQRFIKLEEDESVRIFTRKDIFRLSAQKGLIHNFDNWINYHEARNKTTHLYDEKIANDVYEIIKIFKNDLKLFIQTMDEFLVFLND